MAYSTTFTRGYSLSARKTGDRLTVTKREVVAGGRLQRAWAMQLALPELPSNEYDLHEYIISKIQQTESTRFMLYPTESLAEASRVADRVIEKIKAAKEAVIGVAL
jgi:hypothetical protein